MRIEKVMSKEKIMELYLNEIYLGNRSYGITAASINYFNKSLNELNLEEMAMLAALPKAPSTYNPYRNPIKAMKRRNWVINRLFKEDFINRDEFEIATNKEIDLRKKIICLIRKLHTLKRQLEEKLLNNMMKPNYMLKVCQLCQHLILNTKILLKKFLEKVFKIMIKNSSGESLLLI